MDILPSRTSPTFDPVEHLREIARFYVALDERQRRQAAAEFAGWPRRIHESARNGSIAFKLSLDQSLQE